MITNRKADRAWAEASANATGYLEELPPQVQYAVRRVGGPAKLSARNQDDFTRAFNESPIVDADENEVFYDDILVRAHEPKDGVR